MLNLTLSQMKAKLKNDLDLNEETFISDTELTGYFNDAVDSAEQDILALNQDYFYTHVSLPLVNGTAEYSLPSDIYAQKIRGIEYQSGVIHFRILPLKYWKKTSDSAIIDASYFGEPAYRYVIRDDGTTGRKIRLYPAAQETSSDNVKIYYLRNAKRFTSDSDICDLPEAYNYIWANVKRACLRKEFGGITPGEAQKDFENEQKALVESLSVAIPDNFSDEIDLDLSHYREHN